MKGFLLFCLVFGMALGTPLCAEPVSDLRLLPTDTGGRLKVRPSPADAAVSLEYPARLILMAPGLIHINYQPIRGSNECLADAVGFQTALQVQYPGTWSRILKLSWNAKAPKAGRFVAHAYCVYELNHQLYAYDSEFGQRRLALESTAKFTPQTVGRYLAERQYGSADYLPAFDPSQTGTSFPLMGVVDRRYSISLRSIPLPESR